MLANLVHSCLIVVDGGCRGNGGENPKGYGNFKVFVNDQEVSQQKFDLVGATTNNQAEWEMFVKALEYIGGNAKRASLAWVIKTDSALVRNQFSGAWKCKDASLKVLQMFAQDYAKAQKLNIKIEEISGDEVKRILGH